MRRAEPRHSPSSLTILIAIGVVATPSPQAKTVAEPMASSAFAHWRGRSRSTPHLATQGALIEPILLSLGLQLLLQFLPRALPRPPYAAPAGRTSRAAAGRVPSLSQSRSVACWCSPFRY